MFSHYDNPVFVFGSMADRIAHEVEPPQVGHGVEDVGHFLHVTQPVVWGQQLHQAGQLLQVTQTGQVVVGDIQYL